MKTTTKVERLERLGTGDLAGDGLGGGGGVGVNTPSHVGVMRLDCTRCRAKRGLYA